MMASLILQVTRHVLLGSLIPRLSGAFCTASNGSWAGPGNKATLGCTELTSN